MITINLGTNEYYDDDINQFIYEDLGTVSFEYSLKALYLWEGKWKKPFLKGKRTDEELIDFYVTMALEPIEPRQISYEVAEKLAEYISDVETATTFTSNVVGQNGYKTPTAKIYTAEELYALMISAGVPLEWENRNLNRLLVILRVIAAHNNPPKKMSKQDILRQNAQLNAQRKAQMNTKG